MGKELNNLSVDLDGLVVDPPNSALNLEHGLTISIQRTRKTSYRTADSRQEQQTDCFCPQRFRAYGGVSPEQYLRQTGRQFTN